MILDEIAKKTRERINEIKKMKPLEVIKEEAMKMAVNSDFPYEKALRKDGISFICEIKKASPSKGIIAEDFPYLAIAKEYEAAGAAAISVLTEPFYFMGSDSYLEEISKEIQTPIIRKDFTVDEYMIYEAKLMGASAILLICALLDVPTIRAYMDIAHSLGLSCLVEAHDEAEVKMALEAGARIIGVNNRDLKTFQVDIHNSSRLRHLVPESIIFVSESGISTPEDIALLRENGTDAVLIGETFMRCKDKRGELDRLRGI